MLKNYIDKQWQMVGCDRHVSTLEAIADERLGHRELSLVVQCEDVINTYRRILGVIGRICRRDNLPIGFQLVQNRGRTGVVEIAAKKDRFVRLAVFFL